MTGANMFAYCGNDPVNSADPTGLFAGIFKYVNVCIKICFFPANDQIIEENTKTNTSVEIDDWTKGQIIYNQEILSDYSYGVTNADEVLCGVVAYHNIKVLSGEQQDSISEEIRLFQENGAMIMNGLWGSNPFAIRKILKEDGYNCIFLGFLIPKREGLYIVSYANENVIENGFHTIAVAYYDGEYLAYNVSSSNSASPFNPRDYRGRIIGVFFVERKR